MKSIVIYFSLLGHNKEIAQQIANKEGCDILEFSPGSIWRVFQFFTRHGKLKKKAKQVDVSDYDEVIVCGPIWAGKPAAAIKYLLEALDLKGKTTRTYWSYTQDFGETEEIIKKQMEAKGAILKDIAFKNISKKLAQAAASETLE